ncbi:MAG: family 78 glycoside hydrolase catalytic domain [Candidatus Hydrogenedentota bacterium]
MVRLIACCSIGTAALLTGIPVLETEALEPARLRVEYLDNPLGIDETQPRLDWVVESDERGEYQTAHRVLAATSRDKLEPGEADLWDSQKVGTDQTRHVVYTGKPLESRQQVHWTVRVWDADGEPSDWAEPAHWSMGLLDERDWEAEWISFRDEREIEASPDHRVLPPARYYREEFQTANAVERATVYATALGNYDLHINGQRVTENRFMPGWTDYHKRVYYNTFDVTELVREGDNAIGAVLADGWYAGYLGFGPLVNYGPNRSGRYFYGKTPSLKIHLEIEYADGSTDIVATEPGWWVGTGAYTAADHLMGERYDARLAPEGWAEPGFDASGWEEAVHASENGELLAPYSDAGGEREVDLGFKEPPHLEAYPQHPVRPTEVLEPVEITEREDGSYIVNFGQNTAGITRLHAEGPEGHEITIRHGEMLREDGSLLVENLRTAEATNVFTLRGDEGGETFEPRFTFHGFQYAEVTNYPGELTEDDIESVVLHSDTPLVSEFECSDPMLNQFFQNVVWTQRSNFLEIPTDCPQRDERLGWTGDAQVYGRAATYNADVGAFFTKWFQDLRDAQTEEGAYPDYAPYPMQHGGSGNPYATAWTDAGLIAPWAQYEAYGDTRALREHYHSMQRFINFRVNQSPDYMGRQLGNAWGDWLNMDDPTPIEYVDHCYYAASAALMADIAEVLNKQADAAKYRTLAENVKATFNETYVNEDGTLEEDSQTAYVLALAFDLLPEDKRQGTADHLADLIIDNDTRMTTGFLGTRSILSVLTGHGHFELAAKLMQSRRFPSWGYPVEQGATTVWERWDSYTIEDGFDRHGHSMNSFNHYAFGAVVEWMFDTLAGIKPGEAGFETVVIKPRVPMEAPLDDAPRLDHVRAAHESIHGRIESEWRRDGDQFTLNATIPANTTAEVHMPAPEDAEIYVDGAPAAESEYVEVISRDEGYVTLSAPSGAYSFESTLAAS